MIDAPACQAWRDLPPASEGSDEASTSTAQPEQRERGSGRPYTLSGSSKRNPWLTFRLEAEVCHFNSYAQARAYGIESYQPYDIRLVRTCCTEDGDLERSWAYVADGKLPTQFETDDGEEGVLVPPEFHREVKTLGSSRLKLDNRRWNGSRKRIATRRPVSGPALRPGVTTRS